MHLGVCYYPEHWPEAWWPDDARQMVDLGIRQVRIGEFCWSRVEPRPGEFHWEWLDLAVQVLADTGLQIVMCTPTATPPKWLVDQDPHMLAAGADGRPRRFGSRRHYDFSSDSYLAQAERITRAFGERYGRHPAVVAWQTDNEYGCHDTVVSHSPQAVRRFRLWLQQRYGTVAALNEAWGNVFWSQEYTRFAEVDSPAATVTEANPAHRLDYQRFASDEVRRFNGAQCDILRRLSPGRVLVHNFMQLFTAFDHQAVAADLDVASWDSYPLGALEMFWFGAEDKLRWLRTGHPDFAAFHHDLYRGMSRQPFWVMEQQPGPVNWARWNPAPAPGMVRLWTWEAFAHGADVVSYFRWRQAPFGQEQMHAGLQTPDRHIDVGGAEAAAVASELAQLPTLQTQSTQRAAVALVFDYAGMWLLDVQPQGADYNGLQLVYEAYSALRSLGLDIDIVPPGADLGAYALVVLPAVPLVNDALLAVLRASRAQLVLYPRAGSKVDAVSIPPGLPPGVLQSLIDLRVLRVESLRPGVTDTVHIDRERHSSTRWRETVEARPGVSVLARYADGAPALLRQGRTRYLAGWFSAGLQRLVLEQAAADAGLATVRLPEGLRIRRRGDLLFAFNYDSQQHVLQLPQANWVLGGETIPAHGMGIARRSAP
ncbi:MAG: beta-galactosidase [Ideonella sp.]|nr:beta-galactosidase [Ideonella sp.]